ncbi:hypothetical protein NIES4074_46780 [Cylindrospermum sp. NIES-4074]|nr:hypothetical protein NIES4074_46780 [Cylindrospermum sp. NIES-4074]
MGQRDLIAILVSVIFKIANKIKIWLSFSKIRTFQAEIKL